MSAKGSTRKRAIIEEIRKQGQEPRIDILVHGLHDEEMARRIEAAVIDLFPAGQLTNLVRGYKSRSHGRMGVEQAQAIYGAKTVEIAEPAILIRINRLYRHTMSPLELYDATRSAWVVGPNRDQARYAFAIYAGVIREVYEIAEWFPEGSTFLSRVPDQPPRPDRWEFVGKVADEPLRKKYLLRRVADGFKKGSQNPIKYVNVD